jgi:hypothetical protein
MKYLKVLPVIVCLLFLFACPQQQRIVPPEIQAEYTFAQAQAWYTPQLETYNSWFRVADLETKRKWARNISPLWDKAGDILVEWEKAVDAGIPYTQSNVEMFKMYKTQILQALPDLLGE